MPEGRGLRRLHILFSKVYVSKSDTALATAAAGRLREAVAGNEPGLKALAEIEAFLMVAGFLRDPEGLAQVS